MEPNYRTALLAKKLSGEGRPRFDGLAVHHTGGSTLESALAALRSRGLLGYNVLVDRDGRIIPNPLVREGEPGQHIRPSWGSIKGRNNSNTEGIAAIARDDSDVTPAQAKAIAEYARARYARDRVWGHGQLNPGHKHPSEGMAAINAYLGVPRPSTPQPPQPPRPQPSILSGSRYDDGTPQGTFGEPKNTDPVQEVIKDLGLATNDEEKLRLARALGGPFAGYGGFSSGGFGSSGVG